MRVRAVSPSARAVEAFVPFLPLLPFLALLVAAIAPTGRAEALPRRVDSVDPFIGTQGMGHCYPGATVPFGMVQLSPDTSTAYYTIDGKSYDRDVYRYAAGYQHGDPTIVGFSHTHFHGTGHSDLGDLLVMASAGPVHLDPGRADAPGSGYRSRYDAASERASPGYYAVDLTDARVRAELTATSRVGVHRYTFPKSSRSHVVLDLVHSIYNYDGKVLWSRVEVKGPALVTGWRHTRGWARDRQLFFAIAFSKPFRSWGARNAEELPYRGFWKKWNVDEGFPEMAGRKLALHFDFETEEGEQVVVKVGISAVSAEGALANLEAEVPHWDFDRVRAAAEARWETELSRVDFEGTPSARRVFTTALYHSFLSPVEYQDVDGRYRGADQGIHRADGFTNHTIFSLWDTYRALHPLFTLVQRRRTTDLVRSLLAHFDESPWGQGYIEGNAWNYSLHVPHDVAWLVREMGGDEAFAANLDRLFTTELDPVHIAGTEDLDRAGFVGSYAHGNEPSHHVPYLYAWAGSPWKGEERIREIRSRMYRDAPDGLAGNDDCGQMSAWYVFSALGFYPVSPCSNEYVLGTPASREMTLNFEDGRRLVVRAPKLDGKNPWVQSVRLNGKPWEKSWVRHEDLAAGGELLFEMGPRPNLRRGRAADARPASLPLGGQPQSISRVTNGRAKGPMSLLHSAAPP